MEQLTTLQLRKLAREKFGRDLTDAEAQLLAPRLPDLAAAVDLLSNWQSRLGDVAPATSFAVHCEVRDDR
jgi:hypothetical protein